jgi:hypothetical protein
MRWRSVAGWEGFYVVSDTGLVQRVAGGKGTRVGRPLKPAKRYPHLILCDHRTGRRETKQVHLLVAAAFLGPCPPGHEVDHKDHNPGNPHYKNLEYVTHRENQRRMVAKHWRKETHPNAKIDGLEVRAIRALRTCGWAQRMLARSFGVSQTQISRILLRKRWSHL